MNPLNRWLEKKLRIRYVLLLVMLMLFLMVSLAGLVRHQYLKPFNSRIGRTLEQIAELPSSLKSSVLQITNPSLQIISNRFYHLHNKDFNQNFCDSNYLLSSRYDTHRRISIIELISLYDDKVIFEWVYDYALIKKKDKTKSTFSYLEIFNKKSSAIAHPLLLKNGSIIFKNEEGAIVKIDSNSKVTWIINNKFHHSTEIDAENNVWSPLNIDSNNIKGIFFKNIWNDAIVKISLDGKLFFKKSIAQILIENGYIGLFMGAGIFDGDLIHLNEIKPALYSTKYWQKGDILISLRHKSTIFLYRPSTNKIIWLQNGPWLNQHCPDFVDSSRISVFGNDVVRTPGGDNLVYGHNNIYIYDLATHMIDTSYNEMMRKVDIRTLTAGRLKILPNKDVIIEESDNGRVLRANKKEVLWQRLNYVDSDSSHVNVGNWSRYLHRTGDCKFCLSEY